MTHTPTPWRIALASAKFIADADGILVAQASVHAHTSFDYAADNAARIVKCVNAHDDLVAACKEAMNRLLYDGDLFVEQGAQTRASACYEAQDLCAAALEKAGAL